MIDGEVSLTDGSMLGSSRNAGDGDRPGQLLTLVRCQQHGSSAHGCGSCHHWLFSLLRQNVSLPQQIAISEQCECPSTLGQIFIVFELFCQAGRHLLCRLGAASPNADRGSVWMSRIDRFSSTPESQFRTQNWRIVKKAVESRRQVRQQRRLNFRDSIGRFETSRLVVPQPCSSPSCHQNPARRPSGQAQPGSHLHPTLASGLSHHSRAAKLVAFKTDVFRVYLQHTVCPASVSIHLRVSSNPRPTLVMESPVQQPIVTVCSAPFGRDGEKRSALEMFPLVH